MKHHVKQKPSPWVKICGNTRLEDCLHAAVCGADAVGFIFAPGKRTVSAEQVASITGQLPRPLEKIGVFITSDPEEIVNTALQAGLTGIQLHCAYNMSRVQALSRMAKAKDRSLKLIQVVTWDVDGNAAAQTASLSTLLRQIKADGFVDRVLIDSRTGRGSGGTGRPFNWAAAKPALSGTTLPVIVAGGLCAENVAEAIHTLEQYGVDVSSGVEDQPGIKSTTAVQAFIKNARTTLSQ